MVMAIAEAVREQTREMTKKKKKKISILHMEYG